MHTYIYIYKEIVIYTQKYNYFGPHPDGAVLGGSQSAPDNYYFWKNAKNTTNTKKEKT